MANDTNYYQFWWHFTVTEGKQGVCFPLEGKAMWVNLGEFPNTHTKALNWGHARHNLTLNEIENFYNSTGKLIKSNFL